MFLEKIDRTNHSSKIQGLIDIIPDFIIEMQNNAQLYKKYKQLVNLTIKEKYQFQYNKLLYILAFNTLIINIILNLSYKLDKKQILEHNQFYVQTLGGINFMLSLIFLAFQIFMRYRVYEKIEQNHLTQKKQRFNNQFGQQFTLQEKKTDSIFNDIIEIQKSHPLYIFLVYYKKFQVFINTFLLKADFSTFTFHVVLSFLGLFVNEIFFAIECISFTFTSQTMFSVLQALQLRWKKFLGLLFLILIILNVYSFIGFIYFPQRFVDNVSYYDEKTEEFKEIQEYLCDTPIHCLLSMIIRGLREDTGLDNFGYNESFKSEMYEETFIFDFSFFLIITLIMLNIINGIIIDAFAVLRDQQSTFEQDSENVCFICNKEKWELDKNGENFTQHINNKHSVWNYTDFLVYINLIGRNNANGPEIYILDKLQNNDLDWFPSQI